MALKTMLLKKELEVKQSALEELRQKEADFEKREAELTEAIEEVETDEQKAVVEENIDAFEAEKAETEEKAAALEAEIASLEQELEERKAKAAQVAEKMKEPEEIKDDPAEERKDATLMLYKRIKDMTMEERTALVTRDDVKEFVTNVRETLQKRAVTNATVVIPEVLAGIITQVAEESSKLLKHVRVENVPGTSRLIVDGGFPEAVWTEQCGKLNELTLGLYDIEVDGYKVGGFVAVCNALLEDADIDLVAYITERLGRSIGYALDKAIVFGTGTKMPQGIIPRLLQTEAPAGGRATAPTWVDLHTSNVQKLTAANSTGVALFKGIIAAAGAMNNKFGSEKFWVMNEKTKAALIGESIDVNAAGAIVSGIGSEMPVIGGAIETLDFMPDNYILGGVNGAYYLAQRSGAAITSSEHALFTDDMTVFKGVARYDGAPAVADAFVAIGINNTTVATTGITFAADTANA